MRLTQTDRDNSAAVLIESHNFGFMRVHKKGGGVAILFNDSFHCMQMSFGKIASFRRRAPQLNSSCSLFFKASLGLQAGLLSITCIDFDGGVIVWVFKIHVHNPEDSSTKQLCCILGN